MLRKDTIISVRLRTEKVKFGRKGRQKNPGQPGTEWLRCVAEPLNDVQDMLRIAGLVLTPYSL